MMTMKTTYSSSEKRLADVLHDARINTVEPPKLIASESNDVWQVDDFFIRICWRGDEQRMFRETIVARALPDSIPYPEIVRIGELGNCSWMITKRVLGQPLSIVWPTLTNQEKIDSARQYARLLKNLHAWTPPQEVVSLLEKNNDNFVTAQAIVGTDVNPLPINRVLTVIEALRTLSNIDTELLDKITTKILTIKPQDPLIAEGLVVVHGDASMTNILWHKNKITALLDFEWVRMGPRDLELVAILGFMREKFTDKKEGYDLIIVALKKEYPELFKSPNLLDRLWLYEAAYGLRQLFLNLPKKYALATRRLQKIFDGNDNSDLLM